MKQSSDRLRLQVIAASTRPGRVGIEVAHWFMKHARAHPFFETELVDLAEVGLPFLDEPNHPSLGKYTKPHTKRWSKRISSADAFVFVMPEYNYGFNAPLKNALDFLYDEWRYKPVAFVSYGGVSGGTRAVQMIKQVVTTLRMVPIGDAVVIPHVATFMDGNEFPGNEILDGAAGALLAELARTTTASALLRDPAALERAMA